ncbi:hypothetical protein ABFS82_02G119800 [Erythranthe guttata]
MARERKRKRVPEVLWRLFGSRARTLADTILSLVPPPPNTAAGCRCRGRRCLSCCGGGDEARSFLVDPGDPSDYRGLLNRCYVVVSVNAPPLRVFDPHCRWPQSEIVRRSIEMILSEEPASSNLICCGYYKGTRSSDVVDVLTSSIWTLLLNRVGDSLMVYLLKYTSIFLPLPRMKHRQITGDPINNLVPSVGLPYSKSQHHPVAQNGSAKKRKRVERVKPIPVKKLCTSSNCVESTADNGSSCLSSEELPPTKREESTEQNTVSSRKGKRKRNFCWHRRLKRRPLVVRGTHSLIPCRVNSRDIELQNGISTSSTSYESNISHCVCCSVFHEAPKMNRNAEIDRWDIFYKIDKSTSMFPKNHILYTLNPDVSGASTLFNDIFGAFRIGNNPETVPFCSWKNSSPATSNCLYHTVTKLLESLIDNTHNCRHLRLLDKHCPIRSSHRDASVVSGAGFKRNDSGRNLCTGAQVDTQIEGNLVHEPKAGTRKIIPEAIVDQVKPSTCYCPKEDVESFVWAICRRIVPPELLGEHSNWRVLRKNIYKFIRLRKFEKFSLKECIHELKISKFPLLHDNIDNGCSGIGITDIARHAILGCWIFWFFKCLVSPLLQANFYVTESEFERNEVLYYRKSTWRKLIREAECMKNDTFRPLNVSAVRKILKNRSHGFSRVRLLPKKTGFRMLANLQASSKLRLNSTSSKFQSYGSVNKVLNDVQVVLRGSLTKEREKFGSSVFDYNDVYRKLVPFLSRLKKRWPKMPRVFIVVSDVSKAFDSVNQDKLLSVMEDVLSDDEYVLEKFTQVFCTKKALKVHHTLALADQDFVTVSSGKIKSIPPPKSLDGVLVNKALDRPIRKADINTTLKEHIKRNVVRQSDKKFYLQNVGIPQGSVLSTFLCSLYYGHMERNVLYPFIEKASETNGASSLAGGKNGKEKFACGSEYILLRFIDDFLFISTSEKQASMYFSRVDRGFRDYNCFMNKDKYGLNFKMKKGQECRSSSRPYVGQDGVSFLRWSGVLVNCSTLEIQADYTRYLDFHLSSTLTVSRQGKVGEQLKSKLRAHMSNKCHPLFYDSNVNSPGVVRLNIYQIFLLCAMKFVCHLSNLSILPKFTPQFITNAIDTSVRCTSKFIEKKMYSFSGVDIAFRPKYEVKRAEVLFLGLYAYNRVLEKKQTRYKNLIPFLRTKLKACGEIAHMSSELKYAIDDEHSSVFWRIKY